MNKTYNMTFSDGETRTLVQNKLILKKTWCRG